MNLNIPTLSFCITCKNRFHQIQKTLPQNLQDNEMFKHLVEFVLVDFGSTDGLRDWVAANFRKEISEGYLKYYYTGQLKYWHASIAKNTSHFYANNDILVNLDCDNYTGLNGGKFVIQQFYHAKNEMVMQLFRGYSNGSYGRICVKKVYFEEIGGYDEAFHPMAHQDTDLINRLCQTGLEYKKIKIKAYTEAIKNTKMESIANTDSKLEWIQMQHHNVMTSKSNISEGRLIANNGVYGIRNQIYDIDGTEVFRIYE